MRSSKQFAFCQSRTVNAIVMQIDEIVRIFGEYSVKFYLALAKFRGGTCPPRPPLVTRLRRAVAGPTIAGSGDVRHRAKLLLLVVVLRPLEGGQSQSLRHRRLPA